ncbi:MAG: hypothetical protein JW900_03805 [Anaerolineae bacterium]|nr:hypothetical protein [Anaerolineae bacterium]
MTTNHSSHPTRPRASQEQTITTVLWLLLLLAAAVLRLTDLGAAPLNSAEAIQALAAHEAAGAPARDHFTVPAPQIAPSPILFHANTFLFSLFRASDGLARLLPTLAGVSLVLTPLLLRRYLGRWGALGTGLLLALSPTFLLASRSVDGTIVSALGTMLLVGAAARFLDTWRIRWIDLGALGLAGALAAGPGGWGLLAGLLLTLAGAAGAWWKQVSWSWPMIRPALRRGAIAAGLGLLAMSTALGLNPAGIGDAGGQLIAWLYRFAIAGETAGPSPITLLLAYEPLLLLTGAVGIVLAIHRRHAMGILLILWTVMNGLQLALMPSREPVDLVWVLLPLAGLGGMAVEELAQSLAAHGHWLSEGIHLPISLVLWAHSGLALARYAYLGEQTALYLSLLTLLLQVLLTVAFGFAMTMPAPEDSTASPWLAAAVATSLRAGGLSLGIVLSILTLSIGWGIAHRRPADPRELALQNPVALEVRALEDVVQHTSRLRAGAPDNLTVAFLGPVDPAVAWSLRNMEPLLVDQIDRHDPPLLVVAPGRTALTEAYYTTSFPLRRSWTPQWEQWQTVRWILYREAASAPIVSEWITLGIHRDLGTTAHDVQP